MKSHTTKRLHAQPAAKARRKFFDSWFDPIEMGVRERVREFIEAMVEAELVAVLSRPRNVRSGKPSDTEAGGAQGVPSHRTGTGRARCWELSGESRSRCRGPG
jgi:hypothetical protein